MKLLLCSNYHANPNFQMMMDDPEKRFEKELNEMWEPHIMKAYYEDFMSGAYLPNAIETDNKYVLHIHEGSECFARTEYTKYGDEVIKHIHVNTGYGPHDTLLKPDNIACIVVHGGNTFNISRDIHQNGWYEFIFKKVFEQEIPYVGYSAGAIMATPFVLSAMWADAISPNVLKDVNNLCGFGFVDFFIKPHDDSYLTVPRYAKQFKDFGEIFGHDFYSIGEFGAILIDGENSVFSEITKISK